MEWTDNDHQTAKNGGWMIQKNSGRDGFSIVKNPTSTAFRNDEEAEYHVIKLAIVGGSALHNKALNIIGFFDKKPPLGLTPKSIWLKLRLKDIKEAAKRYESVGKEIPKEWLEEAGELALKLEDWT